MKAVIVYDKFSLATKAQALSQRALNRVDATTQWIVKPWRVTLLVLPGFGNAALKDAADAHLIVLASRQSVFLPPWLPAWLEKGAERRQVQQAALAVFNGGKGDSCSTSTPLELSQFAGRHGLDLVLGEVGPDQCKSAVEARSRHKLAMGQTPPPHILE